MSTTTEQKPNSFQDIIGDKRPVLVDFYADWCGPCKYQAPILQEVAGIVKDSARIIKINVDKNQSIASQYGIRSIPTLIIFREGEIKWRTSGVKQTDELVNLLRQYAV